MNSATRQANGHIIVHCDACSSTGINHSTKARRISTPGNEKALADQLAKAERIYALFEAQFVSLVKEERQKKRDTSKERDALQLKLTGDLAALGASAPKDTATFVVDNCPWCDAKLGAAVTNQEPAA